MLATCCYVISRENAETCVLIDPGAEGGMIARELDGLKPELILLTHGHYDHVGGVSELLKLFPDLSVACHEDCARQATDARANLSFHVMGSATTIPQPATLLEDEEKFTAAGIGFTAILLPGHAPGHMVFYVEDAGVLFDGDTIFAGGIGRSDLPGCDGDLLMRGLRKLVQTLPGETVLYPGHGPATTIANELKHNPYLR
jgi:glyoxylase-like metal-dependent hydrolase (beta-lactamase superfamily II)